MCVPRHLAIAFCLLVLPGCGTSLVLFGSHHTHTHHHQCPLDAKNAQLEARVHALESQFVVPVAPVTPAAPTITTTPVPPPISE